MYNTGKILLGAALFLGLVSYPAWYTLGSQAAGPPELEKPAAGELCVEDAGYMRAEHADLLAFWRETAVRDGERAYAAESGRSYAISLTGTCLDCHENKARFCDRCHDYLGVKPDCWNCHITPEEPR
ncbi:MAG: sulfate reduction electron transfer complex DsrMKJOP subunit DsrJ [Chloroflexi bacterium]|nr:sulfate reduction electron transfer complex DsrMKJOP subunit DsrJ [Chloroflexota bacterium]